MSQHEVTTVAYAGWGGLKNGELLKMAEEAGFEVFVTGDRALKFQQNITVSSDAGHRRALPRARTLLADNQSGTLLSPRISHPSSLRPGPHRLHYLPALPLLTCHRRAQQAAVRPATWPTLGKATSPQENDRWWGCKPTARRGLSRH